MRFHIDILRQMLLAFQNKSNHLIDSTIFVHNKPFLIFNKPKRFPKAMSADRSSIVQTIMMVQRYINPT